MCQSDEYFIGPRPALTIFYIKMIAGPLHNSYRTRGRDIYIEKNAGIPNQTGVFRRIRYIQQADDYTCPSGRLSIYYKPRRERERGDGQVF